MGTMPRFYLKDWVEKDGYVMKTEFDGRVQCCLVCKLCNGVQLETIYSGWLSDMGTLSGSFRCGGCGMEQEYNIHP